MRNLTAILTVIAVAIVTISSVGCKDKPANAGNQCMTLPAGQQAVAPTPDPISSPVTMQPGGPITGNEVLPSMKYVIVETWKEKDGNKEKPVARLLVLEDEIRKIPDQFKNFWHDDKGERLSEATVKPLPVGYCVWDLFEVPKGYDFEYMRPESAQPRVSRPGPTADGSMYHETGVFYIHASLPATAAKQQPTPAKKK